MRPQKEGKEGGRLGRKREGGKERNGEESSERGGGRGATTNFDSPPSLLSQSLSLRSSGRALILVKHSPYLASPPSLQLRQQGSPLPKRILLLAFRLEFRKEKRPTVGSLPTRLTRKTQTPCCVEAAATSDLLLSQRAGGW